MFLIFAGAFGLVGFFAILRDRHQTAFQNFLCCLVLLFVHYFFPHFPQ